MCSVVPVNRVITRVLWSVISCVCVIHSAYLGDTAIFVRTLGSSLISFKYDMLFHSSVIVRSDYLDRCSQILLHTRNLPGSQNTDFVKFTHEWCACFGHGGGYFVIL